MPEAYIITTGDEMLDDVECDVQWVHNESELCIPDPDFSSVQRAPELDKYYGRVFGEREKYLEGWRVRCWHTDAAIAEDDAPVFIEGKAFSNRFAYVEWLLELNRKRRQKQQTIMEFMHQMPEFLQVTYLSGSSRFGDCTCSQPKYPGMVEFEYRGLDGKPRKAQGCPHCQKYRYRAIDLEDWRAWLKTKELKSAKNGNPAADPTGSVPDSERQDT